MIGSKLDWHRRLRRRVLGAMVVALALASGGGAAFGQARVDAPPYLDPALTPQVRAADLVGRMSLEEKAAQMYDAAEAIPRLGVPAYGWWNEALHGVARAGHATVFPQAIGLAATWDQDLMLRVAQTISDEGRAKYNQSQRDGVHAKYAGLTFWSPNINIFRDPRWGRGQETYGEDPYLTGRMATQFVRGLQGDDPRYLKTVATLKHYAVHSGPEPGRHAEDIHPDKADLHETYLRAFRMVLQNTDVASVMCAYNAVDGVPACANDALLQTLLRGEFGFHGYVVSDCGAIGDFYYPQAHAWSAGKPEAAAAAVKAGTDLNCGDGQGSKFAALPEAVARGLIDEASINQAVERLFEARIRLGMFDDPSRVPWHSLAADTVASAPHLALAEEAARDSLVLLKNDGILPLKPGIRVAVIGPNADNPMTLIANYNGTPTHPVTALAGIRQRLGPQSVRYAVGAVIAGDRRTDYTLISPALLFHRSADGRVQSGLAADYYASAAASGEPAWRRIDPAIDFHWDGSPINQRRDGAFAVHWQGLLVPQVDGHYRLEASRGIQATLDGQDIHGDGQDLKAGQAYALDATLKVESDGWRNVSEPEAELRWVRERDDLIEAALAASADADVILYVGGIDARLEGEEMRVKIDGFEGGDRTSLDLPAPQQALLAALAKTGKPLVVVNFSGSAMALGAVARQADAVVQAFYPGEASGTAIASLLWGDFSPSGRLPVTFYASTDQLPPFADYSMRNRTYKYFQGKPLYPFGYGLSYTQFRYAALKLPAEQDPDQPMTVSVAVSNAGPRAGREVVQLYLAQATRDNPAVPLRSLVGFKVVDLAPGETRTVQLAVTPDSMHVFDADGKEVSPHGRSATLFAGGGQPGYADGVEATLHFTGT